VIVTHYIYTVNLPTLITRLLLCVVRRAAASVSPVTMVMTAVVAVLTVTMVTVAKAAAAVVKEKCVTL